MYLKIANDTKTKSYRLTESAEKPYIVVQTSKSDGSGTTTSKSYLPLTTKSGTGLRMNIKSGTETYRPMEYKSVTSSETFYSSSVNVGNLSSTTALTRASTSGTKYGTRTNVTTVTLYKNVNAAYFPNIFSVIEFTRSSRNATYHVYYGPASMLVTEPNGKTTLTSVTGISLPSSLTPLTVVSSRSTGTEPARITQTTGTTYQTRSSTSGYTGVSSSSYESTGWQ